jgi:uncharacterized protein YegJ (DUF2314 family)
VNIYFKKIALLFFIACPVVATSHASALEHDIRYRTIIYFYPNTMNLDISRFSKYFEYFQVVDELPNSSLKPVIAHSITKKIKESYPVPDLSYLAYFGRGLDKQQATNIQNSDLAIKIDIAYPQNISNESLRAATTSIFNFAVSAGGLIWDSETREMFTPKAWKKKRIDSWSGETPAVEDHIVIHAYNSNEGARAITLGMAKFGLPDIVVNNFAWSLNRPMGNLINLVAQSTTEGFTPSKDGILELNIDKLKNTDYKKKLLFTLKDNAEPTLTIQLGAGNHEEGDPNNYITELLFPSRKDVSLSEEHETLLSSLFGWEDKISYVQHNALITAASERAKQKLEDLRKYFNNGLAPGEFIQVKAPFLTPDGGNEWMWVEVLSWKNNVIAGLLKNQPHHIPNLKGGSEVTVKQEDVFDYIINHPDGTSEGNETGALITEYQN